MSLNPYGKFWSSAQKFSTAIEFYARALMKFLWKSAQFFPVLSNTVPALFISFDLKCPVRFSLRGDFLESRVFLAKTAQNLATKPSRKNALAPSFVLKVF